MLASVDANFNAHKHAQCINNSEGTTSHPNTTCGFNHILDECDLGQDSTFDIAS